MKKLVLLPLLFLFVLFVSGCSGKNIQEPTNSKSIGKYLGGEINNSSEYNFLNKQIGKDKNTLIRLQVSQSHVTESFISGLYLDLVSTSGRKPLDFSRRLQYSESCLFAI